VRHADGRVRVVWKIFTWVVIAECMGELDEGALLCPPPHVIHFAQVAARPRRVVGEQRLTCLDVSLEYTARRGGERHRYRVLARPNGALQDPTREGRGRPLKPAGSVRMGLLHARRAGP